MHVATVVCTQLHNCEGQQQNTDSYYYNSISAVVFGEGRQTMYVYRIVKINKIYSEYSPQFDKMYV